MGRAAHPVAAPLTPMEAEHEPDYRMSLAAERTYLAYLRTGLALTAAGVALAAALPNAGAETFRRVLGLCVVLVGAAVSAESRRRFNAVQRAMRRGEPLPKTPALQMFGWILVGVAFAAAVLILVL
jgi:putative membrane protein